jgi:hypothetical protein
MGRPRRRHPALEGIDADALAAFRQVCGGAGTDEEILAEPRRGGVAWSLTDDARVRVDSDASVHPQTADRSTSWHRNAAARGRASSRADSSAARSRLRSCASSGMTWGAPYGGHRGAAWAMAPKSLIWRTFACLRSRSRKRASMPVERSGSNVRR